MVNKYDIKKINTTDGVRYILTRGGKVSIVHRTYYKTKAAADRKANSLNKILR